MKTLLPLLLLLTGCGSMIDTHTGAPKDAPILTVDILYVSFAEIQRKCGKYMSAATRILNLGIVGARAELNFAQNRCVVWMPTGENDPSILEHELMHCRLLDHPGDSTLRDAWTAYKQQAAGRAVAEGLRK